MRLIAGSFSTRMLSNTQILYNVLSEIALSEHFHLVQNVTETKRWVKQTGSVHFILIKIKVRQYQNYFFHHWNKRYIYKYTPVCYSLRCWSRRKNNWSAAIKSLYSNKLLMNSIIIYIRLINVLVEFQSRTRKK